MNEAMKKSFKCFLTLLALIVGIIVSINIYFASDDSHSLSLIDRRVDKHFFFDLLQQGDQSPRSSSVNYTIASAAGAKSYFVGVMDRTLLVRYLIERFAYSSYLQLGCQDELISDFLPASLSSNVCVDHVVFPDVPSPSSFLASAASAGRTFDVIVIEQHYALEAVVNAALAVLSAEGALILTDTNPPQHSKGEPVPSQLESAVMLRVKEDLDSATLDLDGGLTVCLRRDNQAPLTALRLGEAGVEREAAGVASPNSNPDMVVVDRSTYMSMPARPLLLNLVSFEQLHNWLA